MAINPLPLAGVGLAAVAVAGGLYATGTGTNSSSKQELKWRPLYEDADYKTVTDSATTVTATYSGKYGEAYSKYLAGNDVKNDAWWESKFNNMLPADKNAATDEFEKTKVDTWQKLKAACVASYQADKTVTENKVKSGQTPNEKKYREEDIWKFCSHGGTKIQTIKDKNEKEQYTGNDPYAKENDNESKLVSAKDNTNDWFWELKEKEMLVDVDPTENGKEQSKFKELWKDRKNQINSGSKKVKALCETAYGKNKTNDANEYPKADLFKFCSLSGVAPS